MPALIATYHPSDDLRWLVHHYQVVETDMALPADFEERIAPMPCYSFVFQYGGAYEGSHAVRPEFRRYPDGLITTPVEYPVVVRPTGPIKALRVVMRPHTAELVLRTAASNLRNFVPEINDVCGAPARDMQARMQEAESTAARIAIFENWLRHRVSHERRASRIGEMAFAMDRLAQTNGQIRVRDLATELSVSDRQLERWFTRLVGHRPKFFQRIVRVNALLHEVRNRNDAEWALLASQFGFSDQSHLAREFVTFTGQTPTVYLAGTQLMRKVFQTSLESHVLENDVIREKLPAALVANIAASHINRI